MASETVQRPADELIYFLTVDGTRQIHGAEWSGGRPGRGRVTFPTWSDRAAATEAGRHLHAETGRQVAVYQWPRRALGHDGMPVFRTAVYNSDYDA